MNDDELFSNNLDQMGINFNHSLDPLTWIFDLLRATGSQAIDLTRFGIESLQHYDDMPATSELIASNRSNEEVANEINADWLIYQTLEDLIDTAKSGNPDITEYETSIFTGEYITPLVENYLDLISLC